MKLRGAEILLIKSWIFITKFKASAKDVFVIEICNSLLHEEVNYCGKSIISQTQETEVS